MTDIGLYSKIAKIQINIDVHEYLKTIRNVSNHLCRLSHFRWRSLHYIETSPMSYFSIVWASLRAEFTISLVFVKSTTDANTQLFIQDAAYICRITVMVIIFIDKSWNRFLIHIYVYIFTSFFLFIHPFTPPSLPLFPYSISSFCGSGNLSVHVHLSINLPINILGPLLIY